MLFRSPSNVAICLERGMIAYDEGDFGQAISCYNEAVVAAPDEPYSYLARAYTQEYGMENRIAAEADYRKVLSLDGTSAAYGNNLKGIAFAKLHLKKQAEEWERSLLASGSVRNIDYFYLACMYAGFDVDKSISYLDKALQNGYGDYYRIHVDRYSPVSLLPIRHLSQYSDLLYKYRALFGK